MPFGVFFAGLLLALLGIALPLGALRADAAPLALARVALGMICLNTSIGLLRRQRWARWSALAAFVVIVALSDPLVPGSGALRLAVLFGAALAVLLLGMPATGRIAADPAAPAGRALPLASAAGGIALVVAFGWGAFSAESGARPAAAPPQIAGLAPRVAWESYGRAVERAKSESKPIVVAFETSWCGYCRKMNSTTFKDPSVVERLNALVAVRVNAEEGTQRDGWSGRQLASRFGVAGYPTLVILSPEGAVLSRTSGYLEPKDFLDWIDRGVRSL